MSYPSAVSPSDRSRAHPAPRRPRAWRWVVVLAVVLALHWIAAQWVERNREIFTSENTAHVPVQIALLTPERIERQPAGAAAPRPAAVAPVHKPAASKPREHVLTATRSGPSPEAAASAAAAEAASEAASAAAAEAEAAASAARAASAASAAVAASGAGNAHAAAPEAASGVKFSVPPSGDLQYDTFYNGVRNQPGTIHWSSDGKTYDMVVSVPVPFIGTFSYSSHGHIDAFGLAPDQYIEKRGRRPEDVSIFNRNTRQIVFTRTPASLPLTDAAQDRFSMVMQLASLVRGDPNAYKPGVTRQFFVVDNDSGETWPIETIGDETIRTEQGFVSARHFMRLPRHAGDQRRIDVWLAPSLGWLPARLLQTEPNGTEVELVWRGALKEPGSASGNKPEGQSGNDETQVSPGAASGSGSGTAATGAAGNSQATPANASNAVPTMPAAPATPATPAQPSALDTAPPAPEKP